MTQNNVSLFLRVSNRQLVGVVHAAEQVNITAQWWRWWRWEYWWWGWSSLSWPWDFSSGPGAAVTSGAERSCWHDGRPQTTCWGATSTSTLKTTYISSKICEAYWDRFSHRRDVPNFCDLEIKTRSRHLAKIYWALYPIPNLLNKLRYSNKFLILPLWKVIASDVKNDNFWTFSDAQSTKGKEVSQRCWVYLKFQGKRSI